MAPKINVYLPDELATEVRAAGIPVSAVCQQALADAVAYTRTEWPVLQRSASMEELASSYTKRAKGVLDEARAANSEPTTVDLMAALVESGGLAMTVLDAADIDADDVIAELRARQVRDGGAGPLDTAAERAVDQARGLGHSYVGTEHLLLGVTAGRTRELARLTLKDMGLSHESAMRGVATALSAYAYARQTLTFSGISAPIRAALEDIRSRLSRLETANHS